MRLLAFATWLVAGVVSASSQQAYAQKCEIKADASSVGICEEVKDLSINIGVPPEKVDELVKERTKPLGELTAAQKDTITLLKEKLDLDERQVRAALDILGEANIPPERLAAKLVEIAEQFQALKASASAQTGDDPKMTALKVEAQQAIENGDLVKADKLFAEVEVEQRRALDSLALNAADTAAQRGEIALTRLRYVEAAQRFAKAAGMLPPSNEPEAGRIGYLEREANALYQQGNEFGDNGALATAIERHTLILGMKPRERVPLDWAETQNNLGVALGESWGT